MYLDNVSTASQNPPEWTNWMFRIPLSSTFQCANPSFVPGNSAPFLCNGTESISRTSPGAKFCSDLQPLQENPADFLPVPMRTFQNSMVAQNVPTTGIVVDDFTQVVVSNPDYSDWTNLSKCMFMETVASCKPQAAETCSKATNICQASLEAMTPNGLVPWWYWGNGRLPSLVHFVVHGLAFQVPRRTACEHRAGTTLRARQLELMGRSLWAVCLKVGIDATIVHECLAGTCWWSFARSYT